MTVCLFQVLRYGTLPVPKVVATGQLQGPQRAGQSVRALSQRPEVDFVSKSWHFPTGWFLLLPKVATRGCK